MPTDQRADPSARFIRLALVGALLGAFASAYLLVDYVFGSGICLTGSGCDLVRTSAFAYPLGIPMPLLGLAYYLAGVVLLLADSDRSLAGGSVAALRVAWALIGVAVMSVLTFVELVVIGAVCSWCMLSAIASLTFAAGTIGAWRRSQAAGETNSSRARRRLSASNDKSRRDLRRFTAVSGVALGVLFAALLAIPAFTTGTALTGLDPAGADTPRLGDGPVEVVVFSDYQCPACAVAAPLLSELADAGEITLAYRFFPLVTIHANATAAAEAAQAAALQGRFWEFHDALFATQPGWADLPPADAAAAFEAIAADVGLDVERWRVDAAAPAVGEAVDRDRREAEQMQLSGTPTIFIEGERYDGRLDASGLLAAVRRAGPAD